MRELHPRVKRDPPNIVENGDLFSNPSFRAFAPGSLRWEIKSDNRTAVGKSEFLRVKLVVTPSTPEEIPSSFALHQNYPNPFNPKTVIKYDLPAESEVTLRAFNILGEEVRTLVNEVQTAGCRSVEWDSRNNVDRHLRAVYIFYRMQARNAESGANAAFVGVKKLPLIKSYQLSRTGCCRYDNRAFHIRMAFLTSTGAVEPRDCFAAIEARESKGASAKCSG